MKNIIIILLFFLLIGCNKSDQFKESSLEKYWSTLDSSGFSIYLGGALEKSKIFTNHITADSETDQVSSGYKVDAADDPAIWINTKDPEKSVVLGTNKKGGVHVYDIQGKELQFVKIGCINNIDLRDGFKYNGKEVVLVAASNCTLNSIALFYIDKETSALSDTIVNIKSTIPKVYGICLYNSKITNDYYVFLNGEHGDVEQWLINSVNDTLPAGRQDIEAKLVRQFSVSSKPEGMVADDEAGVLFIGVEEEGVQKVPAEPDNEVVTVWVKGSNPDDRSYMSSDIEGLAYFKSNNKTYLVASSQGNFSYAIFEIGNPDKYITSFTIKDGEIDGAEETDGLEIYDNYINEKFPEGILVVQDGYNFIGDSLLRQNFKYISLDKVKSLINI